jgi:hypothetical protein
MQQKHTGIPAEQQAASCLQKQQQQKHAEQAKQKVD